MKRLFNIELRKTLNFSGFWVLLAIHAVLFIVVSVILSNIEIGGEFGLKEYFSFSEVWNTCSWLASWFNLLFGILIIILVGNEFSNRTFRQNIIDGLSRSEFLLGKAILAFFLSLYAFIIVFLVSMIYGFIFSENIDFSAVFEKSHYIFIFIIQAFAYISFAAFVCVLLKNMALSIVLFLVYMLMGEAIVRAPIPNEAAVYFPAKVISNLTPMPGFLQFSGQPQMYGSYNGSTVYDTSFSGAELNTGAGILVALAYIAFFWFGSFFLINRRDI